jgi:hypothetical protein
MLQMNLSEAERAALIERIARWATAYGLGAIVSFLLEINRPLGVLSGQMCIACAPLINAGFPWPVHQLGLLLQDGVAVRQLQQRIEELAHADARA